MILLLEAFRGQVEPDQVREKGKAPRCAWLRRALHLEMAQSNARFPRFQMDLYLLRTECSLFRSHRFLVVLGALRPRLSALLRAMKASEELCGGLWSSEEALEEAQVELLDGQDVEDVSYSFEAQPLAPLQLEAPWLLGMGCGCLAAIERAASCAVQLVGARLMLAGGEQERERAKEYVQWAQQSRKGCEQDLLGIRGGERAFRCFSWFCL